MKQVMTLAIVTKNSQVLLGMKKRGFGAGRWNGFGGKVESGESIEQAALREVQEEVGITPTTYERVGVIDFRFSSDQERLIEMHVFHVTQYTGSPAPSEEMEPDWFSYDQIPYAAMWVDDVEWLPFVLTGRKFVASCTLDAPATNEHPGVIEVFSIDAVTELP